MSEFKTPEYRLPEKRQTIELDDVGLPGGEMSVSLRMPVAMAERAIELRDSREIPLLVDLFLEWADARWNLHDAKGLIPVTAEGLRRFELLEQYAICTAWVRGVVHPSRPLSRKSSSGARSEARSPRPSRARKATTNSSDATPATP